MTENLEEWRKTDFSEMVHISTDSINFKRRILINLKIIYGQAHKISVHITWKSSEWTVSPEPVLLAYTKYGVEEGSNQILDL